MRLYYSFSEYLQNTYGEKVYKLPINIPCHCPNRDGSLGTNGCIFCGEEGAGFENLPNSISVVEQINQNMEYIGNKYKAEKFIAYFQNYSNTYLPFEEFKKFIEDSCRQNVVAIYISTRPDCINSCYLEFLRQLKEQKGVDIVIELGLQTINYHSLKFLQRGHLLAEFIDAVLNIKKFGIKICAHMILDLPFENRTDVIEGARVLSALGIEQVKCHSLYILENTQLGEMYKNGEIFTLTLDEFLERASLFLEHLNPEIVVQRLLGRAPKERTLFCSWNTSWWKIVEMLENKMTDEGRFQGKRFDYLNGSALKKLL